MTTKKSTIHPWISDDLFYYTILYYLIEFENFSQALSRASSLSYAAGIADFDSVNNFAKEDVDNTNANSNLEQSREAISQAKGHLDKIVAMLQKTTSS